MEKKNQKLFIIIGVLLLSVGVSLAYFTSKALNSGEGAATNVTTASINGAKLNIEGVLEFTDVDILPGHKSISGVKITATGNNELIPYNLIWQGTNTLTTPLNFVVYKTNEKIETTSTCEKKVKVISGAQALSEECNISSTDKLGTEISSGIINKEDTKVILVKDEFITAYSTGNNVYYYIILEYPNLDEPQNGDIGGTLEGNITVEKSDKKPDINILAAYVIQEDGTYKEVEDIPQSGYTINQEKSMCSNGAVPVGNTPNITVNNLTKSGTSCYLYFDKLIGGNYILSGIDIKEIEPDFNKTATTNEGVLKVADQIYGGESYYWRGAVTNNYVKFAKFCWRIVRINGDGSIRLIYDGSTCHDNGTSTIESIAKTNISYSKNGKYEHAEYVGYTYTEGEQRPINESEIEESNLKTQTESWFDINIAENNLEKIDLKGKYCNDRNTPKYQGWHSRPSSTFYYEARERLETTKVPKLSCHPNDIYELKVGALTADEIAFAGGLFNKENLLYYLYNGQDYWTISPYNYWCNSASYVRMFHINTSGNLESADSRVTIGLRPVINLKSDVVISSGNGTIDKPYIID